VVAGFDVAPTVTDILVSTIPAEAQSSLALPLVEQVPVIFDVIYDPWPTALSYYARTEGRILVSGLDLLVHQARGQFCLMTGIEDAPLETMREAGERALAKKAGI
jgi:shikimate dehydrogenase